MDRISPFPDVVDPIGYVRRLAYQVAAMYPSCLHLDDVVGHGLLALVQCQGRFDPRRGVRFSTYAWCRVRGAMVDLVRAEARHGMFLRTGDLPELACVAGVEEDVIDQEAVDHLHRAVSQLPARQSQYLHGLLGGNTEVLMCRRMKITRGAGRELRQRAFVNLRRALSADQEKVLTAAA